VFLFHTELVNSVNQPAARQAEATICEVECDPAASPTGHSGSKLSREIWISPKKYEGKTVRAASLEGDSLEGNKPFSVGSVALAGVILILTFGKLLKTVHTLLTPGLFSPCQRLEIRNRAETRQAKT
jgi:hypothetical protein